MFDQQWILNNIGQTGGTSDDHGTPVPGTATAPGNNDTGVSGVNCCTQAKTAAASYETEAILAGDYAYVLEMSARYMERT